MDITKITREVLARVLEEQQVPGKLYLKVVQELKNRIKSHEQTIEDGQKRDTAYLKELRRYERELENVFKEAERLTRITHLKGDKGDPGYTPRKGVDYFDGKPADPLDVNRVVNLVMAQVTPLLEKEEDEKLDEAKLLDSFIARIKKEKLIDVSDLKNFQTLLRGKKMSGQISGSGVPSLSAGTNVTLTPKSDGGYTVSATGGTSGANVATQVVTAVQAGANVTIALSQLTHFATLVTPMILVMRNQIPQTPSVTYTETAAVVTVLDSNAGDVFAITYAYA